MGKKSRAAEFHDLAANLFNQVAAAEVQCGADAVLLYRAKYLTRCAMFSDLRYK